MILFVSDFFFITCRWYYKCKYLNFLYFCILLNLSLAKYIYKNVTKNVMMMATALKNIMSVCTNNAILVTCFHFGNLDDYNRRKK